MATEWAIIDPWHHATESNHITEHVSHHKEWSHSYSPRWWVHRKNSKSESRFSRYHHDIPLDREIKETIAHAIMSNNRDYISFTRTVDEPTVDYMYYLWVIRESEKKFSYDQKFSIDKDIWLQFIRKYESLGKKIELMLHENPMLGAGMISYFTVISSSVTVWFVVRLLDRLFG